MASRRARIKGIANIPPRKKPTPSVEVSLESKVKLDQGSNEATSGRSGRKLKHEETGDLSNKDNNIIGNSLETRALDFQFDTNKYTIKTDLQDLASSETIEKSINNNLQNSNTTTANKIVLKPDVTAKVKSLLIRKFIKPKVSLKFKNDDRNAATEIEFTRQVPITEVISCSSNVESEVESKLVDSNQHSLTARITGNVTVLMPDEPADVKPIVRRKFLKPNVNYFKNNNNRNVDIGESSISKEISITEEIPSFTQIDSNTLKDSNRSTDMHEVTKKIKILSDIRILPRILPNRNKVVIFNSETANNATMPNADLILKEAQFNSNEILPKKSASVIFAPHKRCIPESQPSQYPPPRSRIKAIPNLRLRKASCSASESEDETRKYGRIRNNSVCSVASTSTYLEPATPRSESVPSKGTPMLPKKLIKTEQSKKLAEAKRDFQIRFGAKTPDKEKLRIIDLIYYNPETNHVSQQKPNNDKSETKDISDEGQKENETDNMPVPQMKIGSSGEIIIDEQSLIVENAELVKQREKIANSSIVDGDTRTGYGFFKRNKRAANWTSKETIRFYKALNVIGTDFTTMADLFPRRTRNQLKLKFKREEKTNSYLIDKAITEYCRYDFADLKREFEIEEKEEALLVQLRNKGRERRKEKKMETLKEKATKMQKNIKSEGIPDPETKANKSKAKRKRKPLTIDSVLETSEEDGDISDAIQSDADKEENIPFLKPTRLRRIPEGIIKLSDPPEEFYKLPIERFDKKFYSNERKASLEAETTVTNSQVTMVNHATQNRRLSSTSSVESNSERLVPGSVVSTAEEALDYELKYKVYSETPDQKKSPLQLESSIIERLVRERQSAELPLNSEKNETIPSNEVTFIIKEN